MRRHLVGALERRALDFLPGLPARVGGVLGPLGLDRHVLDERAAEGDVEDLDPAAHPEDRQPAVERTLGELELEDVAKRLGRREVLGRLLAVARGVDVPAAAEEDPVAHVERVLEVPVHAREAEADAAGKRDRPLEADRGVVAEVVQPQREADDRFPSVAPLTGHFYRSRPRVAATQRRRRMATEQVSDSGGTDERTAEFVAEWRNAAYNCYSLGPQVLPRGLPGHAGHARRGPHAHVLPRQRRGDGEGPPRYRGRGPRLRPLHAVRRVRAALPEHPLHRRLLPLPHAHGRPRQGGARARRRERASTSRSGSGGTSSPTNTRASPCSTGRRSRRSTCADWAAGPRPADRRRDRHVLRLRGRVLPHDRPARGGADPQEGGRRVRPHAASSGAAAGRPRRWATSTRRGASPSTTSPTGARSARSGSSSSTRTTTSPSPRTTRATSARTTTSRSSSSSSSSPS